MIPAPFEYHAATSVEEALRLLQAHGSNARLLAGGHSLLPLMRLRLAAPAHVIDLGRIGGLRHITPDGDVVRIGATTTHWMIESSDVVRQRVPLLAATAAVIGDVQVRNLGTIGGSLAHADPAADYPAALLALEAEVVAEGPGGRRAIPVSGFFTAPYVSALRPDEILVEVRVPAQTAGALGAYRFAAHPASGFAIAGVAALVRLGVTGTPAWARIGVTGVGPVPYRARAAEDALTGMLPGPAAIDTAIAAAAAKAADGVEVIGDHYAPAGYRRHLATVYAARALNEALGRATV